MPLIAVNSIVPANRLQLWVQATAADFVQNYLPADVVAVLDLAKLQPEKETFIDSRLRKHFSDLLYSVPLKSGGRAYLYLLFEHKSQPDKQARLQLLRYMTRIWEQVRKQSTVNR
jgi:predicted transposase/invertase (TIGR01784 family)